MKRKRHRKQKRHVRHYKPGMFPAREAAVPVTESMAKKIGNEMRVDWRDIPFDEFRKGIEAEQEHTSDLRIAAQIALDHLREDQHYYAKLKRAGLEAAESPRRSAEDYDSPDDALEGAASRIGAEWYIRNGDEVTVFMRSRDGYYVAHLFKKGGWFHWPTDWPEEIRNLPIGARRVPHAEAAELPRWQGHEASHAAGEEGVGKPHEAAEQSEPSAETAAAVPWVKLERDPKAYAQQIELAKAVGPIKDARAVYDMLAPSLAKEDQEVFLVVAIDIRGQCRGVTEVARGARSRVSVDVPETLRVANALGGEMFCVVHNHPTTHAKPSPADKSLTKAIEKAAKSSEQVMMDHVIVGMGEYYSFADNEIVKVAGRQRRSKKQKAHVSEAADAPTAEYVIAPQNTPAWLIAEQKFWLHGKPYSAIEVDVPEEDETWVERTSFSGAPVNAFPTWEDFRKDLFSQYPHTLAMPLMYREIRRGAAPEAGPILLGAIGIRHNGSPVWWTDLDEGPVAAASLYDLARHDQPYTIPRKELRADVFGVVEGETDKEKVKAIRKKIMRFAGKPLWLLSLQQWDDQEFPAPSQGGPPYIEHVSVGREAQARA